MTFLAISVEPGKEAEKKKLFWQGNVFPNCQKITSQMLEPNVFARSRSP